MSSVPEINEAAPADYSVLKQLGFSRLSIAIYESLFRSDGVRSKELAARLGCSQGLYRNLKDLEITGFVTSTKKLTGPTYFFAVPLERALTNYRLYLRRVLHPLVEAQFKQLTERRSIKPF